MSDYEYDEQFPFVAVNALGFGFARFTCRAHVEHYAPNCTAIDTTPEEARDA